MFLNILKRDLKRKKTMNFIILLFVILSAMFFSSSMNNIVSVMGGVDRFLDLAGMKDYAVIVGENADTPPFSEQLDECSAVKSYTSEATLLCSQDSVRQDGKKLNGLSNMGRIVAADQVCIRCFDQNDAEITDVPRGKFMMTNVAAEKTGLRIGDTVEFTLGSVTVKAEYAGSCKDAVLGSEMIDLPRIILNSDDFETFRSDSEVSAYYLHKLYMIETDDIPQIDSLLKTVDNCRLNFDRATIKMTYILNITVAGIIMAVSVFLIIISFVVLRFTIRFTVQEEFREIGVMKAIGIKNRSIRGLYLVKYFCIAVIGAAAGFFAGIPFGRMLLDSVSKNMVLGNDHPMLIGSLSAAAVVGVILLFCWGSTAKIKKLSPIDAVRDGQTGERFRKKNVMHLGKSKLGAGGFLSFNNVISCPKQSAILTAVFTLCTVLVMILSNTAETLASDKLMFLLSVTDSDAYLDISHELINIQTGSKTMEDVYTETERKLAEHNMPGKVHAERIFSANTELNGKTSADRFLLCSETTADQYRYNEGSAPQYANEIALGYPVAEEIGAKIGDTVTVTAGGMTGEYILTGLFDSMSNLGKAGRFHESVVIPDSKIVTTMALQIEFDDHPDDAVINERIAELKTIFDTEKVFNKAEYVNDCTKSADAITGAKNLTMIVSILIILMMSILLERSFIFKEKSEIALLKAIGFKTRSVIGVHILRFVIISFIAVALAAVVSNPATKLIMDPLFGIMGAVKGLTYAKNPMETFLIFPAIVFAAVIAGTFFTALTMHRIKASDTSAIE